MYDTGGSDDVTIMGCPRGADLKVIHSDRDVVIATSEGRGYRVHFADWKDAVCRFSDVVQEFYVSSPPRHLDVHDEPQRAGYEKFRSEWARRRSVADHRV
jgi:hypothetical protein